MMMPMISMSSRLLPVVEEGDDDDDIDLVLDQYQGEEDGQEGVQGEGQGGDDDDDGCDDDIDLDQYQGEEDVQEEVLREVEGGDNNDDDCDGDVDLDQYQGEGDAQEGVRGEVEGGEHGEQLWMGRTRGLSLVAEIEKIRSQTLNIRWMSKKRPTCSSTLIGDTDLARFTFGLVGSLSRPSE